MLCCDAARVTAPTALPLRLRRNERPPFRPSLSCLPASNTASLLSPAQVGCAGRKLTDISHAQEVWLEFAAVRFGYGRVTVDSGFSLLFELVGEGERSQRGGQQGGNCVRRQCSGRSHRKTPSCPCCCRRSGAAVPGSPARGLCCSCSCHAFCLSRLSVFLPPLLPADGRVYDSVKLHNSRANMRGCDYAAYRPSGASAAADAAADVAAAAGPAAVGASAEDRLAACEDGAAGGSSCAPASQKQQEQQVLLRAGGAGSTGADEAAAAAEA